MSIIFNFFLIPFLVGLIIMPAAILFSKKTGKVNDISAGDALKIHKEPKSLLGGSVMLCAMLIGLFLTGALQNIFLATGMLVIFGLGFWDDLFWKNSPQTSPLVKFAALITCSLIAGIALGQTGASIILAFVAIFICINAVNYQDGMDGLAGGLVAISLLGFALIGAPLISLIALGAVIAFLLFNLPPAKIFMGDSGAYLLGFILAALTCIILKTSIIAPIFIIGLPLFDGVFTNIRRLVAGKSIFRGDRSHLYDRLLQKGFSTQKTLAVCYFLQILLVGVGVLTYLYKVL